MSVLDSFAVPDQVAVVTGGNRGLGRAVGVITPKSHTPAEAVAIMTGAARL